MANDKNVVNIPLRHLKSKEVINDEAKRPAPEQLEYGEIAVNYAKGHEELIIKNSDDKIVSFHNNLNIWKGTLTEYVAILEKDPNCIYFIVDNSINNNQEDE